MKMPHFCIAVIDAKADGCAFLNPALTEDWQASNMRAAASQSTCRALACVMPASVYRTRERDSRGLHSRPESGSRSVLCSECDSIA